MFWLEGTCKGHLVQPPYSKQGQKKKKILSLTGEVLVFVQNIPFILLP